MATSAPATFAALLESAVKEPGVLSEAYRAFHRFSISNQLLAWGQCVQRGILPGPLATFMGWKGKGRHVRKGERAITLCRPVTVKRATTDEDGTEETTVITRFVYRPFWFVLSQTDGESFTEPAMPTWDKDTALAALNIQEIPFDGLDGNVLGFVQISCRNRLPALHAVPAERCLRRLTRSQDYGTQAAVLPAGRFTRRPGQSAYVLQGTRRFSAYAESMVGRVRVWETKRPVIWLATHIRLARG